LRNEAVLFIHGKQVSEYEHTRIGRAPGTAPRLHIQTPLRYAGSNLSGNDQQRQRGKREMTVVRNGNLRKHLLIGLVILMATSTFAASNLYNFTLPSIDGKPMSLADFKGKVILMVNVASQCGYTPQYTALEAIYKKYKDQGFVILGFPANNFGEQEPGTNEEIKTFCSRKYSVSFPLYSKISVKGADQAPLYQYLTKEADPSHTGDIKWNFTKFLVDRNGNVVQRFEPAVTPDSAEVVSAIEKLLKQ
jgi:glutathione peroxidase